MAGAKLKLGRHVGGLRRQSRHVRPTRMMAGSTYGTCFRVTTFGESHGKGVGCVVDGVPPRLRVDEEEVQKELDRRRPGQNRLTTPRKETDTCEILSGVHDGKALGTPIAVVVRNKDQRSGDYKEMSVRNNKNSLSLSLFLFKPLNFTFFQFFFLSIK